MNTIQEIIWARTVTPRDQVFLLRMLDTFGVERFEADITEFTEMMSLPKSSIYESIKRLRATDWLEVTPVYTDGSYRRLKKRGKTIYKIKVGQKEAEF